MMRKLTIQSIQTNSGFLEDAMVPFSPQLTCVIGARGTCKSTVVESIRFALDGDADRISKLVEPKGKIRETLGSGSVRCIVQVQEHDSCIDYVVEREIGGDARVSRRDTREPTNEDVLDDIEIYSQGDLQLIASREEPQHRLRLIDRPNRVEIDSLEKRIAHTVAELMAIGSKLRTARLEIEKRRLYVRDIDNVRAELGLTLSQRPELPPTLEQQHSAYMRRQRTFEYLGEIRTLRRTLIESIDAAVHIGTSLEPLSLRMQQDDIANAEIPAQLLDDISRTLSELARVRQSVEDVPVAVRTSELEHAFEMLNRDYFEQRQQQVALGESLKAEDQLKRKLSELEKAERELKQFEASTAELAETRQNLRSLLTQLRDAMFGLRVAEADRINTEFGDVVLLSIERAATSKPYIARISALLAGSRIRTQDEIAKDLAIMFPPAELLGIIESGDAPRVATTLDRDLGQITRAITYLRDHPDLYDLEGDWPDDSLEITMFDNGTPKPVEQLSSGQRATALLPLILRSASCPLIIDQPEDDLDNSFIFEVLVKNIRRLKSERQLIFITHNANIPVLGEAEQVVVMHMDSPTKAAAPRVGSLDERKDDILHLLEGGREAFDLRERRYRSL